MTDDKLTQAEKRAVLEQDRQARRDNSFYGRALHDADSEMQGRFGQQAKPTVIRGGPDYPGGAHWSRDPLGPEPSLGYSVNDLPVIGEPHEVAAAAARAQATRNLNSRIAAAQRDASAGAEGADALSPSVGSQPSNAGPYPPSAAAPTAQSGAPAASGSSSLAGGGCSLNEGEVVSTARKGLPADFFRAKPERRRA
jgi:hypothetical protein